jgi:CHAD domain-containing protein
MREREFKFTPGPSFRLPPLTDVELGVRAETSEPVRLAATYFDTDDLRLSRAGASLRYRDPEGWTVKLPVTKGALLERDELHCEGDPGEPPAIAVDLVRALVRTAPLAPVARLLTRRDRVVLRDPQGDALGEIADDEVSVLDGPRLVARFRELEVELGESAPSGTVDALLARLRAAGSGPPHPVSKIVRALGPRAQEPPDLQEPPEPRRDADTREIVRAAFVSAVARIVACDPAVRLGDDPEDIHKMRVATRRLRSDLRTFRKVLDDHWSEPLRAELKWLGGLLGEVRDTEVLLDRLEGRLDGLMERDRDTGKRLLESLRATRDEARVALLDAMRSDRYGELLESLVVGARRIPFLDYVDDLDPEDFVCKPWRKLRRGVDALGDEPLDTELHRVRILAKRCRYATEAIAPAVGKPARRFARRAADLQDVLGEHQDAIVAGQWLRDHASGSGDAAGSGSVESLGPERSFVAGELAAVERAAAAETREEWPHVWRKLRRARPSKW